MESTTPSALKIIIIGPSGSGKTAIVNFLAGQTVSCEILLSSRELPYTSSRSDDEHLFMYYFHRATTVLKNHLHTTRPKESGNSVFVAVLQFLVTAPFLEFLNASEVSRGVEQR